MEHVPPPASSDFEKLEMFDHLGGGTPVIVLPLLIKQINKRVTPGNRDFGGKHHDFGVTAKVGSRKVRYLGFGKVLNLVWKILNLNKRVC